MKGIQRPLTAAISNPRYSNYPKLHIRSGLKTVELEDHGRFPKQISQTPCASSR